MFSLQSMLLGGALALDAAVVSFAVGILNLHLSIAHKFRRGLLICLLFGFFQALMVWLGSHAGYFLVFSSYGYLFQLIVSSIFFGIGVKVIKESLEAEEKQIVWGFIPLIVMAIATSIDALVAGISLGAVPGPHLMAAEIGVITFLICLLAYGASFLFNSLPTKWLLRLASLVFFFLGGKTIYEHYL